MTVTIEIFLTIGQLIPIAIGMKGTVSLLSHAPLRFLSSIPSGRHHRQSHCQGVRSNLVYHYSFGPLDRQQDHLDQSPEPWTSSEGCRIPSDFGLLAHR